jgi:hypothetical protein
MSTMSPPPYSMCWTKEYLPPLKRLSLCCMRITPYSWKVASSAMYSRILYLYRCHQRRHTKACYLEKVFPVLDKSPFSTVVIVAIAAGGAVGVIALVIFGIWWWRRRRVAAAGLATPLVYTDHHQVNSEAQVPH